MKSTIYIFFLFFFFLHTAITLPAIAQEGYPIPQKTKNLLFYIQRNHNKNTVIYDLNMLSNGKINPDKPVNSYWIRYEEGGVKKELSYLQLRAYGIESKLVDKAKASYILHLNSFDKKDIYLLKAGKSYTYKAYININGELSELTKLYIQVENNAFGFPILVQYVDITGVDLKTGEIITERFVP